MSKRIKIYKLWRRRLIQLFVKWGYERYDITTRVLNDEYKLYFEEGCTPQEAIQLDGENG